jgi:hypothetical protein
MQDYAAAATDTALQIHLNQPEGEWQGQAGRGPVTVQQMQISRQIC